MSDSKASVFSCYMSNISDEVLTNQRLCVEKFLPKGWDFQQVRYVDYHGNAMQRCTDENLNDVTIFLDIDCVPLNDKSFRFLHNEKWTCAQGALVGCAQRANHILNNKHVYVGPFCMAFSKKVYVELGSPSFMETHRGDVGEELTYCWQEHQKAVYMLWPSDVQVPKWDLFDNFVQFGLGTTYEGQFYHAFCARSSEGQSIFLDKCNSILGSEALSVITS
jgi:hypothetical protein